MIRSFLVLALPLAISAASSNAGAGFDVDGDVDFKAKVIASINQFQGNRRKMLNNAFRDLEVSVQCMDESLALDESAFLQNMESDVFDQTFLNENCKFDSNKATCDLTDMFAGVKDSCEKEGGQTIRLKTTMSQTVQGQYVTVILENMTTCIGKSCDGKEFVKYMQDEFDALAEQYYPGATFKVESGAHSTRMQFGAAVASVLAVAGVTFLN
jgi:hypothetical protein